MARISGVDLPKDKQVIIGLTYIFGIGPMSAQRILTKTSIGSTTKIKDLREDEVLKLREAIEQDYKVEGDLRRDVTMNVKRLMDIGSYRGLRHRRSLPVNGQRTKTNARTRKGPKKGAVGMKMKKGKK